MRTEPATGVGEFRPSAAFPLPRLRPVADFVALPSTKRYITIQGKFGLALDRRPGCGSWSRRSARSLVAPAVAAAVTWPLAVMLLLGVVAVPGFLLTFSLLGIALDHPPAPSVAHPTIPVTVVITARNQPRSVVSTLAYLRAQDYDGAMSVLLVDNGSTDATIDEARRAAAAARARSPHRRRTPPGRGARAQHRLCVRRHAARGARRRGHRAAPVGRAAARRPHAPLAVRHGRGRRRTRWCATRATATSRSSRRTATPSPCTRASGSTACSRRRSSPRDRAPFTAPTRCAPCTAGHVTTSTA